MPCDTVIQFSHQHNKNTWWLLLHPPNQPFSLAQPPSVLPAAQKWYEALLCIQKSFLTFGILYDVGNSFYVLPTYRHQMAFFTLHSLCVYVCVLFYLQRALYVPHADHVDFLNKNIGM